MAMAVPEPSVTAIVLANNESVNASMIGRALLALFYGECYTPPRQPRPRPAVLTGSGYSSGDSLSSR
jgi:hypothetical protein